MGHVLRIEKWAENLDEVTLNQWLREVGESLEVGDSLCETITDKATFEYEMEVAGTLHRVYATEKSVLPVGYAIAFVGEPGEAPPEGIPDGNLRLLAQHQAAGALHLALNLPASRRPMPGRRVRATPAARRAARVAGVELEVVAEWLGGDRTVGEHDVQAYLEQHGEQ